jgi:transposase
MKRTTKYVALDVHQATTVATVRISGGRVIARSILPTEACAITEFFAGMRGSIHVAFEEGTQAQWLHDLVSPLVDRVVVCDLRGEHRGNKADRLDADKLSQRLLTGDLRPVYHGSTDRATLREFAHAYSNLVEDATRVMLRLKALFRARGIRTPGKRIYGKLHRARWIAKLPDERGVRLRAEVLYTQLDLLHTLRPRAKSAMISEARRDPGWDVLRTIPFLGPVRIAMLLATLKTPWRFRTKRNLWGYAGLAVVTTISAEHDFVAGRVVRRHRRPLTRGLNKNHNRRVKSVFKATAVAALGRPGPFRDFYDGLLERGMHPDMARLTLARKIAAVTLRLWKTGEAFDPTMLSRQPT